MRQAKAVLLRAVKLESPTAPRIEGGRPAGELWK